MKKTSTVYWSVADDTSSETNWNILYYDLYPVYQDVLSNKDHTNDISFFRCPGFINVTKNTFFVKNPLRSKFFLDESDRVITKESTYVNSKIEHQPSIMNNRCLTYGLSYYFFSEDDIEVSITAPYFHKHGHSQYGAVIPGKMNISKWFRSINIEFNLWENVNDIEILEDEPMAYFNFNTENNVELKRFKMNSELHRIAKTCALAGIWEPRVPLLKRYRRFTESKTNNIVLQEIKNQLVEE